MADDNVEIVRGVYAAWARRDEESAFAAYAPDIEWDMNRLGYIDSREIRHGHDGIRNAFREILTAFQAVDLEPLEFTAQGEQVLVTVRERVVGRASGIDVDRLHYAVWRLRNGKIVRLRVYLDRNEAVDAVG